MDIIKLRIMAASRQQVRQFADFLATTEGIQTDGVSVHPNYKGDGFREYVTAVMDLPVIAASAADHECPAEAAEQMKAGD